MDIKGLITENDQYDDENFLSLAISFLDKEYSTKPRIILTGDTEGFKYVQQYRRNEKVFRKGNESERNLFSLIKEMHSKLPEIEILKKYQDVFEVFELGLLSESRKVELIEVIKKLDSTDQSDIKNSLGRIRDLQEEIFGSLNRLKNTYLPDSGVLNQRREVSVSKAHGYLVSNSVNNGYEYPDYLSEMLIASYKTACGYGVHTSRSDNGLRPSKYTVYNALFTLMDLILWYKNSRHLP
ncbi:hypothetical protein D3C81_1374930 [compost metagenome]